MNLRLGLPVDLDREDAHEVERTAAYHNLPPRAKTLEEDLLLPPINQRKLSNYRRQTIQIKKRVSPTAFLPWSLQAFPYLEHQRCRSSHLYFSCRLSLMDFQSLRALSPFQDHGPGIDVANIWVALCPTKGTTINYIIANRAFKFSVPLLANLYEVFSVPDEHATYVTVTTSTPSTAFAIVAKFSFNHQTKTVEGFFKLLKHPKTADPTVDHLTTWPSNNSPESRPNDGGMTVFHTSGSFPQLNAQPWQLTYEILANWKEDETLESLASIEERSTNLKTLQPILLLPATSTAMKMTLNFAQARDRFHPRFPQAKQYIEHANHCIRYATDTPFFSEPFFMSEGVRRQDFPPKAEAFVQEEGQFLLYTKDCWSLTNDPDFETVWALALNLHHNVNTGLYSFATLRPELQASFCNPDKFPSKWQYDLCTDFTIAKTKAFKDWIECNATPSTKRERRLQRDLRQDLYDEAESHDQEKNPIGPDGEDLKGYVPGLPYHLQPCNQPFLNNKAHSSSSQGRHSSRRPSTPSHYHHRDNAITNQETTPLQWKKLQLTLIKQHEELMSLLKNIHTQIEKIPNYMVITNYELSRSNQLLQDNNHNMRQHQMQQNQPFPLRMNQLPAYLTAPIPHPIVSSSQPILQPRVITTPIIPPSDTRESPDISMNSPVIYQSQQYPGGLMPF